MKAGLIILDKPSGISSAAALSALKKHFPRDLKVGHAGTLDPMATGLLVVLLGKATKCASAAQGGTKVYSGTIRLGIRTDTDDACGNPIGEEATVPQRIDLEALQRSFSGTYLQMPPPVSAKKVAGKRAYALARAGKEVVLTAQEVTSELSELWQQDALTLQFRVTTGSGFYVRSMARDIGEHLGCGAHLTSLRREASFPFHVDQACQLESPVITPLQALFADAERQSIPEQIFERLETGALSGEQFAKLFSGQAPQVLMQSTATKRAVLQREKSGEYRLLTWYEDLQANEFFQ
jgi:tRNA pseudouridine55 synthase